MEKIVRRAYRLTGVVQGVGFRPHVAQVARKYPISGFCGNDDVSVFIQAQGDTEALDGFMREMLDTLPPLAYVADVLQQDIPVQAEDSGGDKAGGARFEIAASKRAAGARTLIPPDVTICEDCLADIQDPQNRRYGYAFTTCTNCGPRLSIIKDLPYDRPLTTMADFPMCPQCQAEYADSADRRYHAQPISCYECGPHIWLVDAAEIAEPDPFAFLKSIIRRQSFGTVRAGRERKSTR
ncbi:acylphosphatase [Arcanobacterium hippocoleae]